MGSRIMHLVIANQIAEKIAIKDKDLFLIGGIAPDAVAPKAKSHFYRGTEKDYSTTVDFDTFLKKYPNKSDYILGYYTHLIADYVWIKGFYQGWLKNRIDHDEALYKRYHQDFRVLNGKLLKHYQIDQRVLEKLDLEAIPDLDEVKAEDVQTFIPYLLGDMDYPMEHLQAELKVFTFQQIIGYLETSIEIGIMRLNTLGVR